MMSRVDDEGKKDIGRQSRKHGNQGQDQETHVRRSTTRQFKTHKWGDANYVESTTFRGLSTAGGTQT